MRALVLIAALGLLTACSPMRPGRPDPVLADSPLWPAQHQMPAEQVCEGSEDVPACVREVEAERVAAGREAEPNSPR